MTSTNEEKDKLMDNEQGKEVKPEDHKEPPKENPPAEGTASTSGVSSPFTLKDFGMFIVAFMFEFFGTFLFVTAVLLGSGPEAAIISFWIIITMIAPFSGGHVNPAVTFGFYIYDLSFFKGFPKLFMYILAQLAGAYMSLKFCSQIKESQEISMFKEEVNYKEFMSEFFYTGTFVFVILYSCSKKTQVSTNRALNCVMIAAWLYYAATSAGKRSVGALNPAILTSFVLYNESIVEGYYEEHKKDIWSMYYAHFGAALAFAILFFIVEKLFPDSPEAKKDEKPEQKPEEKHEEKHEEKLDEKKDETKVEVKS